ncbi:MAG TPA: hypothetical protein VGN82_17055 [Bosea sp. (in: a-proteobacteria)]|uniref:hypothetical protein n=1 Tax=Bosea sp. (in: a-proteobacteria) TaxID=1871050 RepID=UPI002E0FC5EE|nr:hypothetical protein [Bosea sp. (in: a-proteobacteria)]
MPGDDYVCTFVRCDAKGSMNFYAAAPGPDIEGQVVLDIDGQRFPMTFRKPGSPQLQFTNRAAPLPPGFFAALKAGKVMKIRDAGLKAGYDTIPLRNADREIGRIEQMCGIASAATPSNPAAAQARAPALAETEALRRGAAEGAAYCKANITTAPGDLAISEIEAFCSCMGVNEFAMTSMDDATKAMLRPRQQQACVAEIRKGPAPSQAAPTAPVLPETARVVPTPPASASTEQVEAWTLTRNRAGAPIAYVRATPVKDPPSGGGADRPLPVDAFLMFCRAPDTIGFRVLFKPGNRENGIAMTLSAGNATEAKLDRHGVATQQAWASLVQDWEEGERHTPADVRTSPDFNPSTDFGFIRGQGSKAAYHIAGNVVLEGLGAARTRLRSQCATAVANGAPVGNFDTTGIDGFADENVVLPASVTAGAPPKTGLAKIHSEAECRQLVARTANAVAPRLNQALQTMSRAQAQNSVPLACSSLRAFNAIQNEVKRSVSACDSFGFVKDIIRQANQAIAQNNANMRRGVPC